MLGDNGGDAQYFYWCYGGTHSPPTRFSFKEARLAHIDSGVCDVGPTFTLIENTVVYLCGFSSQIPYLIWGSRL